MRSHLDQEQKLLSFFLIQTALLLLFLTAVSSFTFSVLEFGIDWIDNAQVLSQAITILVLVSLCLKCNSSKRGKKTNFFVLLHACRSLLLDCIILNSHVIVSHPQFYYFIGFLSWLWMASNCAHVS